MRIFILRRLNLLTKIFLYFSCYKNETHNGNQEKRYEQLNKTNVWKNLQKINKEKCEYLLGYCYTLFKDHSK